MGGSVEVSARIGAAIVKIAQVRGAEPGAIARRAGFDPAIAADPDARIAIEVENALWDAAAEAVGDPYFGLHAAAQLRPGNLFALDLYLHEHEWEACVGNWSTHYTHRIPVRRVQYVEVRGDIALEHVAWFLPPGGEEGETEEKEE